MTAIEIYQNNDHNKKCGARYAGCECGFDNRLIDQMILDAKKIKQLEGYLEALKAI